ncbi:MAG: hypothetical protein KatS3mg031_0612 [Chitinophagales bacterium]|nr:MAG: hypothetical protein KatS3mg031_0612 [Chitinophagales bacterium]
MKQWMVIPAMFLAAALSAAQSPNYSEHVAPIIYSKCTNCHRAGGIAPFKLESYSDAYTWSPFIASAVANRVMPPWPPDPNYTRFLHERILTEEEINTIVDWVNSGAPRGNADLEPPVPYFPPGRILPGTPDLTIKMPVYESKADNVDEYACFSIPSGLTKDKFIRAIEIVPGNIAIVHHVIVFAADSAINDCTMSILLGQTLMGYAPGAPPTIFPSGDELKLGMKLKAGSNILLQMHYPKGTAGQLDSTVVNFYFYPDDETGIREVVSGPYLQNFVFPPIQPNTLQIVEGVYLELGNSFQLGGPTREDKSLLAVFPHMHLIGKTIVSYAIDPAGDTIPLVRINNWDFEWQGFYFYKNLVKIPAGSQMIGWGLYDNTVNNHHNPYRPPQTITVGEATTDEMFLISYLSLPYQPGDENHDLEKLMSLPVATNRPENMQAEEHIVVFPNPSEGKFIVGGPDPFDHMLTEIKVTDATGKIVLTQRTRTAPFRIDLGNVPDGVYFLYVSNNRTQSSHKLLVSR